MLNIAVKTSNLTFYTYFFDRPRVCLNVRARPRTHARTHTHTYSLRAYTLYTSVSVLKDPVWAVWRRQTLEELKIHIFSILRSMKVLKYPCD